MVGTRVRERKYEAIMANTTAMANGVNRYLAAPVSSSTGTNTMQMARVETKAGMAICCEPSSTARMSDFFMAMLRWMFSMATVASSTRMPTARAMPPSVMTLTVWPSRLSTISDARIESGMEMQTIRVLRQLPRNIRIMRPVRNAALTASRTTPLMAARTNTDWSNNSRTCSSGVSPASILGRVFLTLSTTASVEAFPFLNTVSRAPRRPLVRTTLVCTV